MNEDQYNQCILDDDEEAKANDCDSYDLEIQGVQMISCIMTRTINSGPESNDAWRINRILNIDIIKTVQIILNYLASYPLDNN